MPQLLKSVCLLVMALVLMPAVGSADETMSSAEARSVVTDYINAVTSYSAKFSQTLRDETGQVIEQESGEFWLRRPGRFRWHYTDPSTRQIVASLDTVWLYDADLDQVTIRPLAGELEQTPAALLVGEVSALDDYLVSGVRLKDDVNLITLEPLTPRGDFDSISLGFQGPRLVRLELNDRFGQQTVINFSAIKVNPPLNETMFEFAVPSGADILDQRLPE